MANKLSKEQLKEAEQKEETRKEQVNIDYRDYVTRIESRIAKGENAIVKSYADWVRKAKRVDKDLNEVEIEVSGESGETRNEKFKRLGKARMVKTLEAMDLIINLSSPQYEATDEEIIKMVNALHLKVMDVEKSFKAQSKKVEAFEF